MGVHEVKRLVFVTGAGRGIGRHIALHLCKSGYEVVGCARSKKELDSLKTESGGAIRVTSLDVTDPAAQQDWFESEIAASKAQPWGLVTAAGIFGAIGSFLDVSLDEWREGIEINLYGSAYSVRSFASILRQKKLPGRIVLLSGGGATKPMPQFSSYCASKAGVVRWGETVAQELKPLGITLNCLAPGPVNTQLTQNVIAAGPSRAGQAMYDATVKQLSEGGQDPQPAAELTQFLLGDESQAITGRLISAVWDPWKKFSPAKKWDAEPDLYTLRRVVPPQD